MAVKNRKTLDAVLDWKTAPSSNSGVDIESKVLGKSANVKYFLTDNKDNFTQEILQAEAIIIYQKRIGSRYDM